MAAIAINFMWLLPLLLLLNHLCKIDGIVGYYHRLVTIDDFAFRCGAGVKDKESGHKMDDLIIVGAGGHGRTLYMKTATLLGYEKNWHSSTIMNLAPTIQRFVLSGKPQI